MTTDAAKAGARERKLTPEQARRSALLEDALLLSKRIPDVAANRFWLARVCILSWAGDIPLMAFCAPDSMLGRALERSGSTGSTFMAALAVIAALGLTDVISNGLWPLRWRWATALMRHRHVGYMLLSSQLVMCGSGLMQRLNPSLAVMSFFVLPAALCVAVTAMDLRARHRELRGV